MPCGPLRAAGALTVHAHPPFAEKLLAAARGAGNTQERKEPESDASKKRRALAGCRDSGARGRSGFSGDEKACVAAVLGGKTAFMLKTLDGN